MKSFLIAVYSFLVVIFCFWFFWNGLNSVSGGVGIVDVVITPSDGFLSITSQLKARGVIDSRLLFVGYGVITGNARVLKPGTYRIALPLAIPSLYSILVAGPHRTVSVLIPEGANMYDIDAILTKTGIGRPGDFWKYAQQQKLEGRLFPDTYFLYLDATPAEIAHKLVDNFTQKTSAILPHDQAAASRILTIASLLEKEVRSPKDQSLVSGLILKRLAARMALQLDATVCYAKQAALFERGGDWQGCYPLSTLDFEVNSPYNTYLHRDIPPGPIGNPGLSAISAVLHPTDSPYWFYLTDPATGVTIFSKTFEEHSKNRRRYLLNN